MANWIAAYFSIDGAPATGLTPAVTGRKLSDNSVALAAVATTEVGSGWYKYSFADRDTAEDYVGYVDGGATVDQRYVPWEMAAADADLVLARKLLENDARKSGDVLTVFDDDKASELKKYNLANGGRVAI